MRKTDSKVRRDPKGRILRPGEYYDEVKQTYLLFQHGNQRDAAPDVEGDYGSL